MKGGQEPAQVQIVLSTQFSRQAFYTTFSNWQENSSKSVRWRPSRLPHPDCPGAARGALAGIVQAVQLAPASAAPDRRRRLALLGAFFLDALLAGQHLQTPFSHFHRSLCFREFMQVETLRQHIALAALLHKEGELYTYSLP